MTEKQDGSYTHAVDHANSTGLSSSCQDIIHSLVAIEMCMDDERLHKNARIDRKHG